MKNIIHTLVKITLYYWARIMSAPVILFARWCVKHTDANPVQKVEALDKIDEIEQKIQEIHIFGLERDREFYLRVLEGRFEDEELWREEGGE